MEAQNFDFAFNFLNGDFIPRILHFWMTIVQQQKFQATF